MKKALIISADNFEDLELLVPYYRLQEAGIAVDIASDRPRSIKGMHGYEVQVDTALGDVNPEDYGVLVLPGGKAPAEVRHSRAAQDIARHFFQTNKPVAAICHGPQILISSGLMRGRHATCYPEVVPELREAGADYDNRAVIVDRNLITSRDPNDLPAFNHELMKCLAQAGMAMAA